MHRLTARLLVVFALVGNFVPVALALSAAPPAHACCVRKVAVTHPCHGMAMADSAPEPEKLTLRGTGCCNHDCCRGVTVARWAQAEAVAGALFAQDVRAAVVFVGFDSPRRQFLSLLSTRGPPRLFLS